MEMCIRDRLLTLHGAIEIDFRHPEIAAVRHQQLARKLVVRQIVRHSGVDPPVIRLHSIWPKVNRKLRLDPQQLAPAHGPIIGKFIAREQAIDKRGALRSALIGEELRRFVGRRKRADNVDKRPPQKDFVGAG